MKLAGIHLTVTDLELERQFWQKLLTATPKVVKEDWVELRAGDARLTLSVGESAGAAMRPVFEYSEIEMSYYIQKAQDLGAELMKDGLNDPHIRGAILRDPEGHEFQITRSHR